MSRKIEANIADFITLLRRYNGAGEILNIDISQNYDNTMQSPQMITLPDRY